MPLLAQNKPAAKPAAAPKTSWTSLEELEKDFEARKLAAIEQYLNEKKTAPDRADALEKGSELAMELGKHDNAKALAEKFLAEFASDDRAGQMKLRKAQCLAATPGTVEAAKTDLQALADAEDLNVAVAATDALANLLLDAGDAEGAKAAYEKLGEKHRNPQLKQFLAGKTKNLDLVGKEPTPIDVTGMDGKPIKLTDYKGKVLLIDFWATWCGPCIAELPHVLDAYKKHHPKGFEIVGISLDRENDKEKLEKFVKDKGMTWPQYFDGKFWKNDVAVAYGVQSIPATYLLDKEGKVYRVGLRGKDLEKAVAKLLGSGTPPAGAAPAKEAPKDKPKGAPAGK